MVLSKEDLDAVAETVRREQQDLERDRALSPMQRMARGYEEESRRREAEEGEAP